MGETLIELSIWVSTFNWTQVAEGFCTVEDTLQGLWML